MFCLEVLLGLLIIFFPKFFVAPGSSLFEFSELDDAEKGGLDFFGDTLQPTKAMTAEKAPTNTRSFLPSQLLKKGWQAAQSSPTTPPKYDLPTAKDTTKSKDKVCRQESRKKSEIFSLFLPPFYRFSQSPLLIRIKHGTICSPTWIHCRVPIRRSANDWMTRSMSGPAVETTSIFCTKKFLFF